MKTIIRIVSILGMFAISSASFALSVSPGDEDYSGSAPKNPDAGDVECILAGATYDNPPPPTGWTPSDCETGELTLLYKDDVGGGETGNNSGDYTTTYNADLSGGSIVYDGPDAIDCVSDDSEGCWLLVKDGNNDPIWYLFDLGSWDGKETIALSGFWPAQGAISHVSIFSGGGSNKVPEPGTLALLGLGLFGMGIMRRRKVS